MAGQGDAPEVDRELAPLPPGARWREWLARIEAVLFASAGPVRKAQLARGVGLEGALDDLRAAGRWTGRAGALSGAGEPARRRGGEPGFFRSPLLRRAMFRVSGRDALRSRGGPEADIRLWDRDFMIFASFLFAATFALVHLGIGWLTFLDRAPRSRWLSAAGGVAVAYIFLHVLPELAAHRVTFSRELGTDEAMAEGMVYSLALVGLIAFYGLERAIKVSRKEAGHRGHGHLPAPGAFWPPPPAAPPPARRAR